MIRFNILITILVLAFSSCRKDVALEPEELNLTLFDTVPFYGIHESSVWAYENTWNDNAPAPYPVTY